jgi:pimeloyl-ACP methyl ester carboxylesterase
MCTGYGSAVALATLLRGFEVRTEEVAGVRTRWYVAGEGDPLVVVHGLGGAAVNFTELGPLLARRRRVLIPDLPGHGGTSPLERVDGLGSYAEHVAAVAAAEGMLPAAVLGYSMGGVVALRLAVARPADVRALALVSPAGIVSTTRRAEIWLAAAVAVRPARIMARFRDVFARRPRLRFLPFGVWGADDPPSLSSEAVHGFLAPHPQHTDVGSAGRALLRDDPRGDLDRVGCPVLLLWGARDRLVPLEDGFEYARRLRAPIRTVPGAGHLVVGEQPEACTAIIEDFLGSVRA